jgi:hypothetical protein
VAAAVAAAVAAVAAVVSSAVVVRRAGGRVIVVLWRQCDEPKFQIWNFFRGAHSNTRRRRKTASISKVTSDYLLPR